MGVVVYLSSIYFGFNPKEIPMSDKNYRWLSCICMVIATGSLIGIWINTLELGAIEGHTSALDAAVYRSMDSPYGVGINTFNALTDDRGTLYRPKGISITP